MRRIKILKQIDGKTRIVFKEGYSKYYGIAVYVLQERIFFCWVDISYFHVKSLEGLDSGVVENFLFLSKHKKTEWYDKAIDKFRDYL